MSAVKILNGITWGHSRGISPLQAASQRFNERNPGIEIRWKKRSLQEFADFPIEELTRSFDLLIIDHPWAGRASVTNCVLPLEQYLPDTYLQDQAANSVGYSHLSYHYDGSQWALAIDAATPAASYRPDLLHQLPETWEDLLLLAENGKVAVPAIPIDLLMNFYTFCIACGEEPFQKDEQLVSEEKGIQAIETMKQLYSRIDRRFFNCNPIAVAELMSSSNDYWYCPFAYGYSNYARKGYAEHLLLYTNVVKLNGSHLRTTIGGTGLAVSAFSEHRDEALAFAQYVVSGECQRTFYVQHGGQPGHLSAWKDAAANLLTHNYFTEVLPLMENGYVRPRYNGYLHFQDHAGNPLQQCLMEDGDPRKTLQQMNAIYRESRLKEKEVLA